MAQRLVFSGPAQVAVEEFDPPAPKATQVVIKTKVSLVSPGTEGIVFNRMFDPGTHWDRWVKYPFYPGYAAVGEVVEAGRDVTALKRGDLVAVRLGHASMHVAEAAGCYPIPKGLTPTDAAWFALAKIAFMGALAAEHHLGDRVAIIGAGPIGQMSVRWARAAGARDIVSIDFARPRLELARRGGATAVVGKSIEQAVDDVKAALGGALPRVVIDGTGNAKVFQHALAMAAPRGRVVVLGDTGAPGEQRLSSDVIMKGLTVVGAHDSHSDGPWPEVRIVELFFGLLADGRFNLSGMITHTFAPAECVKTYALVSERRPDSMGIGFDWSRA